MKTTSFLSNAIEGYVKYRKASGRDSHSYIKNVILFDHFCAREYPGQIELSQEIVDRWCRQRPSECTNSCVSRVYPISGLHQIHEQTWNDKNSPAKSAKVCAKNLYAASFHI